MQSRTTIDQVMTSSPHSVGADRPLSTAHDLMRQHSIRHLPVMKGGRIVGVLSDRDIDFALRVEGKADSALKVEDAFTAEVYMVQASTSLAEVVTNMAERRIGCALVVNEREQLRGIFTAVDACRVLGEVLRTSSN